MDERLQDLARALDHRFGRIELLRQALTHPSADGERGRPSAFERLEFLGDRVLGLVVAEMLIERFPDEAEGDLARRQAALVSRDMVARVARTLGLEDALIVAKGEQEAGGRANPAMLADACEAVLGALFSDGGFEPAARAVRAHWLPLVAESATPPRDAKTALQEWAQARGRPLPGYALLGRQGPDHGPEFHVAVSVEGVPPAEGRGSTKRAAEQAAAAALLARLAR
jgi:ribonuclease-3